ncbi:hypothetical protein OF829_16060 [Sphingomonas sp. LB-2]|uniref:hypothetical protein n=1 Tax=Sphingomonas caeni TaxID=2984949 RepID=UPI002231106A|nr:hypothetical protein [Sphingomonas caeni]MCW3848752.1 hypothetical protein [Sphingomonas caeni]
MKLLSLLALMLAAPMAQDQSAEVEHVADSFDQGDWWGLDVTGEGVGSGDTVVLVDGEAVRNGDRVELPTFLVYRQPKASGATGSRSIVTIDCAANTQDARLVATFYTGGRMREVSSAGSGPKPILPASALYRFACTGSHRYATHFGQGSRTRTAAGAFSKYRH